jgi:hypothetical protein
VCVCGNRRAGAHARGLSERIISALEHEMSHESSRAAGEGNSVLVLVLLDPLIAGLTLLQGNSAIKIGRSSGTD